MKTELNIDASTITATGTYDIGELLVVWYEFKTLEALEANFVANMAHWKAISRKTKVIGKKILIF